MEILMGVTAPGRKLCLLMRQPEGVEGRATVVTYVPGARPEWLVQQFDEEFVAVCPALSAGGDADFLGLTGEGLVFFIRSGRRVRISGAGFNEPGSIDRGRLWNLLWVGGQLLAIGYGGQAYASTDAENWTPIAPTFPDPPVKGDTIWFATACLQSAFSRYVFAGEVVTSISVSPELERVGMLGDPAQIAAMIRAQSRRDYGTLWLLENGRWREVELPSNSAIDEVTTADGKVVYLRFRPGVAYATVDFVEMTEVAVNNEGLSALGVYRGQALLADEDSIFILTPEASLPFEPALPPTTDRMLVLSSSDDDLYVIREISIWVLRDEVWSQIAVPPEIVVLS